MNTKKKILILGSGGFLGKNLINQLNLSNYLIIGKSKSECDLLNKNDISKIIDLEKPSIIINCAGIIGSSENNKLKNQYDIFKNNVNMIFNLLDCIENNSFIEHVYFFSSYRCFNNIKNIETNYFQNYDLEFLMKQSNIGYLSSKLILDIQIELFRKKNLIKISNLIIPNLYGEFDKFHKEGRIVSSLIFQISELKNNNNLTMNKTINLDKKLNLLYVKDLVYMIQFFIKNDINTDNIYLSNEKEVYVSDLIKKIVDFLYPQLKVNLEILKKDEIPSLFISNIKNVIPDIKFSDIDNNLINIINFYCNNT